MRVPNISVVNILILVFLPILAIQVRFLVYKRGDEQRRGLAEGLIEAVPHDLSIMGMTLAAVSITAGLPTGLGLIGVIGVLLPIYVASIIPLLESPPLRLFFGCIAYITGAVTYYLVHVSPSYGWFG